MATTTIRAHRTSWLRALAPLLTIALAFGCESEPGDGGNTADAGPGGGGGGGGGDECADVTDAISGDGCCPDGADANSDDDCVPRCGNGVTEGSEQCDDGNQLSGDGCDATCNAEAAPTAFRMTELSLREPHTFALGFVDVTATVNQMLNDFIGMDQASPDGTKTPDGLLDFSMLAVLRPLDPSADSVPLDIVITDCTAPLSSTSCTRGAASQIVESLATNLDATCLEIVPDTTGGYDPPIATPTGRCFVSDAETFDLDFGDIAFSFVDARIAAMYVDADDQQLASGLIRGFLSQSFADGAVLPADLPVVGGKPISDLLKDQDLDTGPGGEPGWWFYLNFTARAVPYSE